MFRYDFADVVSRTVPGQYGIIAIVGVVHRESLCIILVASSSPRMRISETHNALGCEQHWTARY